MEFDEQKAIGQNWKQPLLTMSISKKVCKTSCISSYHGKLLSDYKEWLLQYSVKWINFKNIVLTKKKPDTQKYIPCDSIFMITKNWQNQSMVTEIRKRVSLGVMRGDVVVRRTDGKGAQENFLMGKNVLYFVWE